MRETFIEIEHVSRGLLIIYNARNRVSSEVYVPEMFRARHLIDSAQSPAKSPVSPRLRITGENILPQLLERDINSAALSVISLSNGVNVRARRQDRIH